MRSTFGGLASGCSFKYRRVLFLFTAGMAEESLVNGQRIWRPLLPHNKNEIFAFAHTCSPHPAHRTPSAVRRSLNLFTDAA
jgi:hypothetical protein